MFCLAGCSLKRCSAGRRAEFTLRLNIAEGADLRGGKVGGRQVDHLIARVEALGLAMPEGEEERCAISFAAMCTTLALNYLHHASFAPERER